MRCRADSPVRTQAGVYDARVFGPAGKKVQRFFDLLKKSQSTGDVR